MLLQPTEPPARAQNFSSLGSGLVSFQPASGTALVQAVSDLCVGKYVHVFT